MDASLKDILGIKTPAATKPTPQIQSAYAGRPADLLSKAYMDFRLGIPVETGNPDVLRFHDQAVTIIEEESQAAASALRAIVNDDQVKDQVRAARMAGVLRLAAKALQVRLAKAAEPVALVIYEARRIIDQAMNRMPADPLDRIRWQVRVSEFSHHLAGMTDKERMDTCLRLAKVADEVWPAVFVEGARSWVPQGALESFLQVYQEAFAGPEKVQALEEAKDGLVEVKAVIANAELALEAVCSGLGLIHADWRSVSGPDIVRAWPRPTRSLVLSAVGDEGYAALLDGRMGVENTLAIFRPGLAE